MKNNAVTMYFKIWNMYSSDNKIQIHNQMVRLRGVHRVEVFLDQAVMVVTYDNTQIVVEDVIETVRRAGSFFTAEVIGLAVA